MAESSLRTEADRVRERESFKYWQSCTQKSFGCFAHENFSAQLR